MEDWSLSLWSRDHFRTRELTFDRFPIPNFEIAAVGQPAEIPVFQKFFKKNWSEPITLYSFSCRIRFWTPKWSVPQTPKPHVTTIMSKILFIFLLHLAVPGQRESFLGTYDCTLMEEYEPLRHADSSYTINARSIGLQFWRRKTAEHLAG